MRTTSRLAIIAGVSLLFAGCASSDDGRAERDPSSRPPTAAEVSDHIARDLGNVEALTFTGGGSQDIPVNASMYVAPGGPRYGETRLTNGQYIKEEAHTVRIVGGTCVSLVLEQHVNESPVLVASNEPGNYITAFSPHVIGLCNSVNSGISAPQVSSVNVALAPTEPLR